MLRTVLIDEALAVNLLASHLALLEHSNADLVKFALDDVKHTRSVGVRLSEDVCDILLCLRDGLRAQQAAAKFIENVLSAR